MTTRCKTRRLHPVDHLESLSRSTTWLTLAMAGAVLVAVDRAVPDVGMGPAFIPLIALAGWRLGLREACAVAAAAALLNIYPHHADAADLPPAVTMARGALRLSTYAFIVATIRILRAVYDRERSAARRDALTGVLNRVAFEGCARTALARRGDDAPAHVVALADLDGFKRVNDTTGHAAGDAVLRAFAGIAAAALRSGDQLGRLGGDEFVLLLEAATVEVAQARIETLHRQMTDGLRLIEAPVTVSMGAQILSPSAGVDLAGAVHEADGLMYAVKAAGKGGLRVGQAPPIVHRSPGHATPPGVFVGEAPSFA